MLRSLFLALAVLVPLATACTTMQTREYPPGRIPPADSNHRIVGVTRTSGEHIAFDRKGDGRPALRAWIDGQTVVGPVGGQAVRVELAETSSLSIGEERVSVWRTMLAVGGIVVATLFGIAAGSMSASF